MQYTIVGLGNPGDEYEHTRHNVGRMVVSVFATAVGGVPKKAVTKTVSASEWKFDKSKLASVSKVKLGSHTCTLVLPENFMNNSGGVVKKFVASAKAAERMVVVYDDIDIPLGTIKIAFDRGSGGHRGLESIAKALRTRAFVRLRVGIAPTTPSGKLKKPRGEEAVVKHILAPIGKKDELAFNKTIKRAVVALEQIVEHGHSKAASLQNF